MSYDIICFSSAYWDEELWTNKQHMMSRLAERGHRVLYVDPGASFKSIKKVLKGEYSARRLLFWFERINANLWRLLPILLPLRRFSRFKPLSWWILAQIIKHFIRAQQFTKPIIWIYHPEAVRILDHLEGELTCYDCVDDYATFPYYANKPTRRQEIIQLENRLLKLADVVFTTSQQLYVEKGKHNPNTYLVPNVADAKHFAKARLDETEIPGDIMRIAHPIIGFIGALDAYKVDVDLIAYIAQKHPEWSIVLIGPKGVGGKELAIPSLGQTNIHFLGYRQYEVLPNYLKAFDVCIIPYRLSEHTQNIFPMKFFEFLATGKPVVTTALPALERYGDVARMAKSREEFMHEIEEALQENSSLATKRQAVAWQNTWDKRIGEVISIIEQRMAEKR